jgi:hypothetical protein
MMSISTPLSPGSSINIDKATHLKLLVENERAYLERHRDDTTLNPAHKLLKEFWKGGSFGGVQGVAAPIPGRHLPVNTAGTPDDVLFNWLRWGMAVKIYHNGYEQLNSTNDGGPVPITVHACMVTRQDLLNKQWKSEVNNNNPHDIDMLHAEELAEEEQLTLPDLMNTVGKMSMLDRLLALQCHSTIMRNTEKTIKQLTHFYENRREGYRIIDLLYEFVKSSPIDLPLNGRIRDLDALLMPQTYMKSPTTTIPTLISALLQKPVTG